MYDLESLKIMYRYGVYIYHNKEDMFNLNYPKYVTNDYNKAKQVYDKIIETDKSKYVNIKIYDYYKSIIVNEYDSIDDMC